MAQKRGFDFSLSRQYDKVLAVLVLLGLLLSLFLLSGILRAVFTAIILPMVKEVRHVEHVKNIDLFFSVIRLRPIEVKGEGDI